MTFQEIADLQKYYRSLRFRKKFTYNGSDLGVTCSDAKTSFALWAPIAKSVFLLLYPDGENSPAFSRIPMVRAESGVWRHGDNRNMHGTYYLYEIDHGDGPVLTGDPYARACSADSRRCMVVDLQKTNPLNWAQDQAPELQDETIIWETHIKDFSWDPSGGFPESVRGKYLAFTCEDTTLYRDQSHPTGLAYLKELGVNTIELMPFFDYGSVLEDDPSQYNWGYDPVYYNIPEGSYATDAHSGELRIRQCKQMIQSLHKNGFRVIMDVVYNHTHKIDSPMSRTAPGYYYRHDSEGNATNGSCCGNDIATERPMVSNFILNSVLYWAEQYHIDGFRFDLMGLMDVKLLNKIQLALDSRFGKGEKLLFGEPWAASTTSMEKKSIPAVKQNVNCLNSRIGIFCDNTRDCIKGNVFFSAQPGFVGGAPNTERSVLHAARAWAGVLPGVIAPSQIITYVSCHDNLTLYDKLKGSSREGQDLLALNRLTAAIYLTCQGHIFMLSGEEFGRTKGGNDNSYNASPEVNSLRWNQAYGQKELLEYYKGLISIRKYSPGLCDKTPQARDRFYSTWAEIGAAGYYLDNRGPEGDGTLCVIYNARPEPLTHTLLPGFWELWADGENSFRWKESITLSGSITIPACSAMILSQDGILDKGDF